jgi:acetyl-CoA carboxylase carboxyltransferase component
MLHDLPGLMVGKEEERSGILRKFHDALMRIINLSVPKYSVIVRKSYGAGQFLMGGAPSQPDLVVAWPTAQLGFMSPEAGVNTVFQSRLEAAEVNGGEAARAELFAELVADWSQDSAPWEAAAHFYLDDIIDPRETRHRLATALEFTWLTGSRVAPFGC